MTEEQIRAALSDAQVVAATVYGEARGSDCDVTARVAVAQTMRNRLLDRRHRYGDDWKGVCLRRMQYSCWEAKGGAANHAAVLAFAEQLLVGAPMVLPSVAAECLWIAKGVIEVRLLDPSNGATHYYHEAIVTPSWARGLQPVAVHGPHRFFAGVR